MRPTLSVFVAIAGSLAPIGARAGDILNVGDAAPPLVVSGWIKGEKMQQFEPARANVRRRILGNLVRPLSYQHPRFDRAGRIDTKDERSAVRRCRRSGSGIS